MNGDQPLKEDFVLVQNKYVCSINDKEKTACIVGFIYETNEIIIPSTIKLNSTDSEEYTITCISNPYYKNIMTDSNVKIGNLIISQFSFNYFQLYIESITIPSEVTTISENAFRNCQRLRFVKFTNDSKLRKIEKRAFEGTQIEILTFPSQLVELEDGWCKYIPSLDKIIVSPENPKFKSLDDEGQIIIGKSNIDQPNYDCLIFGSRFLTSLTIPNYIEKVCPYSCDKCTFLRQLEIEENSKLQEIGDYAFKETLIKGIVVPSGVKRIGEGCFFGSIKFQNFQISDDSKLEKIEAKAFSNTSLEFISIPSTLVNLEDGWCQGTPQLSKIVISPQNPRYCLLDEKMIIGKSNINQPNYDCLLFCTRKNEIFGLSIVIPDFIEYISSHAFEFCIQLQSVKFSDYKKIKKIGQHAFATTLINDFTLSPQITKIEEYTFSGNPWLKQIKIPSDSNLQTIEEGAFNSSFVEKISIPSKFVNFDLKWSKGASKLMKVIISPDNKKFKSIDKNRIVIGKSNDNQDYYDHFVFCSRYKKKIIIPNYIEHIDSCAFDRCLYLKKVQFEHGSKLKTIDVEAFAWTPIKSISIPSTVTSISYEAFFSCGDLIIIEIGEFLSLERLYLKSVFLYCDDFLAMTPVQLLNN